MPPCFRAAFASWLLMNLLLVVVPRYGAFAMIVTGMLLLCTDLVYYMLIPYNPLVVRFEGSALMFRLGWCFWLVMTAGDSHFISCYMRFMTCPTHFVSRLCHQCLTSPW